MSLTSQPKESNKVCENKTDPTSQSDKPDKIYEDEMHKLNTELQVALLKWKMNSIEKKTKFEF